MTEKNTIRQLLRILLHFGNCITEGYLKGKVSKHEYYVIMHLTYVIGMDKNIRSYITTQAADDKEFAEFEKTFAKIESLKGNGD